MTATGEPTRISGGRGPVVSLEEAISAATAELGLLLAEKTWVQSAELQVRTARSQDAQIQRVQLHDPQPDGVQPDGVQPDDVQPVGAQPGGVQPGGVQLHDVQPGNAQIHAVQLYNWQRRALADWRTAGRRGVVQAVTGAGKTRVGVAAVAEALAEGRRAVVIAPTRVLVGQWCAVLEQQLPGVALSQTLGDTRPWQVLVSTVQSAMRRPAVPFGERALLVVDECHRCGAEGFSQALCLGFDWRLGLTATLERGDDGDETLHSYFGGVVHEVGYREALADELISPFRFAQVSVPLLPAERATYEELTEALRSARDRLIITHELPSEPIGAFLNAVSLLAQDRSRDGGGALARLYMAKFSARRTLLADTPVKMVALNQLSTAVDESNGTIVFTQTKEASLQAARVLSDAGCVSAAIHGELDEEAREERLELFRSGAISSITAPRVLDEGVDVPEADLGIVTAANRSRRQMVQRLGRVLRRAPGKTARFVVMYAEGTVEDPYSGGHIPDFYDTCLPFADGVGRFDLSMPGQLALLHVFLRGGSVEEPAPGNSVVACPADAQAPPTPPATVARTRGRGEPRLDEDGEPLTTCTGNLTDDTVKDYLDRCRRIPLLSAEAEVDLARRMEAGLYARRLLDDGDRRFPEAELLAVAALGDEARETMICSNLRLVVSLAKRYAGHGMEFLDLIQEGNLGLMHAVAKFDWGQGAKFSTYGTHWVKQAISRAMADLGSTIRKPVHVHDQLLKVRRYLGHNHLTWEGALRRFPDGIAELDVPRESLVRLAKLSQPLLSTDQLSAELDDSVVYAPLLAEADDQVEAMLERLSTRWLHDAIIGRLAHEDPRGAFVLRSRHGGVTGEDETLETIGRRLGVTRERVRQIEKASLERARQIAEEVTATQPTPTPKSASPTTALPRAHAPRRPTPTPITAPVPRRADLTRPAPSAGAAPRRALT